MTFCVSDSDKLKYNKCIHMPQHLFSGSNLIQPQSDANFYPQTAVVSLSTNNEFNFPFSCFYTREIVRSTKGYKCFTTSQDKH